jgi:hypothetical protein
VPSTLTVTTYLDGPAGSLRAEIAAAQPGDTIVISPSVNQTIQVLGSELVINKSLTIQGDHNAIQAESGTRVFEVDGATTIFNLSGVGIFGGYGYAYSNPEAASLYDGLGGAILNFGTTTVSSCHLFNNSTQEGGAIYNFGTLTLSGGSLVDFNSANAGGGIYNAGTLTLSGGSLVDSNSAKAGGGIYNAGALAIDNSDVLNNTALRDAGADIYNIGTLTKDHSSRIGHVDP